MLPSPPTSDEKYLYLYQNKALLYTFGIVSTLCLITGSTLFALSHAPHLFWYLAFVMMNGFYLGISYFIGIFSKPFDYFRHRQLRGKLVYECVDVFLPTCGEDLLTLANTYLHVSRLDWPCFHVHVLDDSGRAVVRELAHRFGFSYHSRPEPRLLKKAGNIRVAFSRTKGAFFVIFDADFCPRPDFLKEVMGYFTDPKVAIVQTPQYFRVNPSDTYIQKGAASVQELFYRMIQVNRDHYGAAICVGTNAVYRRSAFEPLGGTYPIEHSEDVHTGFYAIKNAYKLYYVPINIASGLCPDTLDSFLTQQYRWCSGSTSLFANRELFWKTKLPFMARVSFLTGMFYYQCTAASLIFNPLPGLIMILFYPEQIVWYSVCFSLPSLMFGFLVMKLWNKAPYGLYTLSIRQVSYVAHLFALWDKVFRSVMPWTPTGAVGKNKKVKSMRRAIVFFATFPLMVYGVGFIVNHEHLSWQIAPFTAIAVFYSYVSLRTLYKSHKESGFTAIA